MLGSTNGWFLNWSYVVHLVGENQTSIRKKIVEWEGVQKIIKHALARSLPDETSHLHEPSHWAMLGFTGVSSLCCSRYPFDAACPRQRQCNLSKVYMSQCPGSFMIYVPWPLVGVPVMSLYCCKLSLPVCHWGIKAQGILMITLLTKIFGQMLLMSWIRRCVWSNLLAAALIAQGAL